MRKIPLGARVRYWRRASSNRGWMSTYKDWDISRREHYRIRQLMISGLIRHGDHWGQDDSPDRCVYFWEEDGEGLVVGLTRRQEGRHVGSRLQVQNTVPLYQVRTRLGQGKPHLIPIDSIEWLDNHRTFATPVEPWEPRIVVPDSEVSSVEVVAVPGARGPFRYITTPSLTVTNSNSYVSTESF